MKYKTLPELRSTLLGFLRQRHKALSVIKTTRTDIRADLSAVQITACNLLRQLDLRRSYSYWGHCRFVLEYRRQLEACLPRQGAGHSQIRAHMIELIDHCCLMATQPKQLVDEQHLQR